MLLAAVVTVVLIALAYAVQASWPGSLAAVSLYKAHLMALGGWGGYWIDRALFPYARPDAFLHGQATDRTAAVFNTAQIRRAIVVAACILCVGLGA
ncbi:MAG: hypothetical protein KAY21_05565 [Limnohabitans sp.]|nr:hypothetical protein [Limnohabitans sp.]